MWVDFLTYYLLWLHADEEEEAADSKNAVMDFLHPTFASLDLERIKKLTSVNSLISVCIPTMYT